MSSSLGADVDGVALAPRGSAPVAAGRWWRRPWLTPRRSNVALALALAAFLPTVTERAMPLLFTPADALILAQAVALGMAAISLNLLTGYAGQISLGHAALLGTGAFASGLVCGRGGLPMWLGIPAAGVATALVALLIGVPALRLRGLSLAMVTIAFGFAMSDAVFRLGQLTGGSAGVELPRHLWPGHDLVDQADMLAAAAVVLVGVWLVDGNLTRSRLGRAFFAIRENEAVAQSFGIDVPRAKLLAFVLSGAIAGIAGAVYGHAVGFVNSETFPFDLSLSLVIMVVVGGLGSRLGAFAAALVFTLFPYVVDGLHVSWLRGTEVMIGAVLLMDTVSRHPGGIAEVLASRRRSRRLVPAPGAKDDGEQTDEAGSDEVATIRAFPRVAATPVADMAPALVVEGVTVRFGGLVAVDDAHLAVAPGRVVGLIGPNGAGKTTLFNAVSGVVRPESGRVHLFGRDVTALSAHERARLGLARTFQQIGLAKDRSLLENLLLAQHLAADYGPVGALLRSPRVAAREADLEERARAAIADLGFSGREDLPVRLFSHGQQRLVEIACALLCGPRLLMLDEPSAGLAPAATEALAARLLDLRARRDLAILLIEHNVPLVLDVCDEVYVMSSGRILAHGTPEEILGDREVVGAYLGEAVA